MAAYFLSSCKIVNSAPFLYTLPHISKDKKINFFIYNYFDLTENEDILYISNQELTNIFHNKEDVFGKNCDLNCQKIKYQTYWPKKIKDKLNYNIN